MDDLAAIEGQIETAISDLYSAFHRLRKLGYVKEEYRNMEILMRMLTEDRCYLKMKYEKEIK